MTAMRKPVLSVDDVESVTCSGAAGERRILRLPDWTRRCEVHSSVQRRCGDRDFSSGALRDSMAAMRKFVASVSDVATVTRSSLIGSDVRSSSMAMMMPVISECRGGRIQGIWIYWLSHALEELGSSDRESGEIRRVEIPRRFVL